MGRSSDRAFDRRRGAGHTAPVTNDASTTPPAARRVLALAVSCLALAACGLAPAGPTKIRVDAEALPWASMSGYRTYRWWQPPVEPGRGYSEREALLDWRVREAVDRELAARGYRQDTVGKPEFVVRYNVRLSEQSTSSFSDYLAYRAEGGSKDMGEAFMGYEQGTLTIEIVDVASRRVAWRAKATAVIEKNPNGALIAPAVAQMFARFPATASGREVSG